MADFSLQEIEDIKYPKRRPWLILVILVVVVLFFVFRKDRPEESAPPVERVEPDLVEQRDPDRRPPPIPRAAIVNTNLAEVLARARELESRGPDDPASVSEARSLYLDALDKVSGPRVQREIENRLARLNLLLAFTPLPWPGVKEEYKVRSGDSIDKIARKFGTTVAMVQKGNQVMNPNLIRAGDLFKIVKGNFTLIVSKSKRDMVVYFDGDFFKRYRVGTGKYGRTPVGTFEIYDRIPEPTWWRPDGREIPYGDPENILGTRWLAIRATGDTPQVRGYGIHGTWEDESIGKAESAGCIRMLNAEVEEVFDLLPLKTRVRIEE
jgi:lipoprotein-anchoring transpeptidase ErfK/SrfK